MPPNHLKFTVLLSTGAATMGAALEYAPKRPWVDDAKEAANFSGSAGAFV